MSDTDAANAANSTIAAAAIVDSLAETGWVALAGFLSDSQLLAFRELAREHLQQGDFRQAQIGSGSNRVSHAAIRGDQICWLDQIQPQAQSGQANPEHVNSGQTESGQANSVLAEFQHFLESLRLQVNQALYLGLFESEWHFALYPPGGCYQKHIDNFQGCSPRKLTFILYLNQQWSDEYGGQLRLYADTEDETLFTDITPYGGSLVVFLSERFYHEVLPASHERLSLTGWLRSREG